MFNLSANYVDEEMDWNDWLVKLYAALRLREEEDYKRFIFAGGKREDWVWLYHPEMMSRSADPQRVGELLTRAFGRMPSTVRERELPVEYLRQRYQEVIALEDGTFVDLNGNVVEKPEGYVFVPILLGGSPQSER